MHDVQYVSPRAPLKMGPARAATTSYWLPAHLRACVSNGCTVLLDLRRNRYIGLGHRETQALQLLLEDLRAGSCCPSLASDSPMAMRESLDVIEHLIDHGIVQRTPPPRAGAPGPTPLPLATRSILLDRNEPAISLHTALAFAHSCLWARLAMRTRSLEQITASIDTQRSRGQGNIDETALASHVRQFRRLQVYSFTTRDQCLFHALALQKFLASFGTFPTWVIGVRTRPWAAHSWMQHADLVLDDTPEHVLEYTPILVV